MNAAGAIRLARLRAKLSKRELARRAHTSPAAIVQYESGAREPALPTLERIVGAAGWRPRLTLELSREQRERQAYELQQVLDLAEHMPQRRRPKQLSFPPLPK
jgi:transcriptional regulator with XRE-family HTH domain